MRLKYAFQLKQKQTTQSTDNYYPSTTVKLLRICRRYLYNQNLEGSTVVPYNMHFILASVHSTGLQANAVGWVPTMASIMLTNLLLSNIKLASFWSLLLGQMISAFLF